MLSLRHKTLLQQAQLIADQYSVEEIQQLLPAPIVILSAPRSGSTLLFETLRCSSALWSIGSESHVILNAFAQLHPARRNYLSGAIEENDATPELLHLMRACFVSLTQNSAGARLMDMPSDTRPDSITLLEKTPRNALNIPFLARLFPGMRVLFLYRDPRETIASIMEAWDVGLRTGRFVTFPNLPGWDRRHWCLLLPPGWREFNGRSLAEIATFQWHAANATILRDLERIGIHRWMTIRYRDLIDDSAGTARRIAGFARIPFTDGLRARTSSPLPLSRTTVSTPDRSKWRRHANAIESLGNQYLELEKRLERLALTSGG